MHKADGVIDPSVEITSEVKTTKFRICAAGDGHAAFKISPAVWPMGQRTEQESGSDSTGRQAIGR